MTGGVVGMSWYEGLMLKDLCCKALWGNFVIWDIRLYTLNETWFHLFNLDVPQFEQISYFFSFFQQISLAEQDYVCWSSVVLTSSKIKDCIHFWKMPQILHLLIKTFKTFIFISNIYCASTWKNKHALKNVPISCYEYTDTWDTTELF